MQGTCCSNLLKQALVPYVNYTTCSRSDYYGNSITENMLCAGYEKGGVDTCQVRPHARSFRSLLNKVNVESMRGLPEYRSSVCCRVIRVAHCNLRRRTEPTR